LTDSVISYNITRTVEYTQYYFPADVVVILAMVAVFSLFMFLLVIYDFSRMRRVLDYYRLKYTFDRDVESKDTKDPEKLDRREKYFKRRTFKD